ncbi:MAG: hypothetical protein HRU09_09255 [Oligoflexales bacterium]|nr:hypothetical protein [Oligoflexales bacterium]
MLKFSILLRSKPYTGIYYLNFGKVTSYIFFTFILVACGQEGSQRDKNPASTTVPTSSQEASIETTTTTQSADAIADSNLISSDESNEQDEVEQETISASTRSSLRGSWASTCDPVDGNSVVVTFEFSDTKFNQKIEYFSGVNCSQLLMTGLDTFDYQLDEGTINDNDVISFNIVQASAEFTIARQDLIGTVNGESWFGYNDWEPAVTKDVSGRSIAPDRNPKLLNGDEATSTFVYSNNQITIEDSDGEITILNKLP